MDTARLPSGTITFLLTDIEGSTRLWEERPEAMSVAIARHDALAAHLLPRYDGALLKSRGEGDSLFAVFARASDALLAALTLQRAYHAEPWPARVPLRVRVALHTGEAVLRDGDYFGVAISRCARLRAAAHGGQVLLSQAVTDAAGDLTPAGAGLRDLGSHRLKDLQQPQRIFQLLHPDLPAEFPPLRSLEAFAHNLPVQWTSFIGREEAMAAVKRLLATTHLLTLTGSGGCGKTRLALQAAADRMEEYADGIWLVELAALTDAALVPQAAAAALGVGEEPNRPPAQTLLDYLRPRQALLVLDNCEHLLAACAQLADLLLRGCPRLRLLVTSREGLGIVGEQIYRVPSLASPDLGRLPPLERLREFEAVQLFVERARLVRSDFALTEANAAVVAQVCRRLDGIPLALELAGARVRMLSVEQIAVRLDDRFRLLTGGSRTALPRQQTLRALIDWSNDLLSEPERTLLRRLSVFSGGWTLEAAEGVCAGEGIEAWEVLDHLTELVDKSLVVADEAGPEVRYRMLETVRQYGRDRLLAADEAEVVRGRHRDWFLALAEEAEPRLWTMEEGAWLDRLDQELENLRVALEWSMDRGDAALELRLAAALSNLWIERDHWHEGDQWLQGSLTRSGGLRREGDPILERARAAALRGAGLLAYLLGNVAASASQLSESVCLWRTLGERHHLARALSGLCFVTGDRAAGEEGAALFREVGDMRGQVLSLRFLGNAALSQEDYAQARKLYEEGAALARAIGDKGALSVLTMGLGLLARQRGDYVAARSYFQETIALRRAIQSLVLPLPMVALGYVFCDQGDYGQAAALFEESLSISQGRGNRKFAAKALTGLGTVARYQGDYEAARSLSEQGLDTAQQFDDKGVIGRSMTTLGWVSHAEGDSAKARAYFEECLKLRREQEENWNIAECLEGLGTVTATERRPERAARLFGAAEALREAIGYPLPPADRSDYDRSVGVLRAALGELAFAAAWAAGRALSLDEAVACALTP